MTRLSASIDISHSIDDYAAAVIRQATLHCHMLHTETHSLLGPSKEEADVAPPISYTAQAFSPRIERRLTFFLVAGYRHFT